MQRHLSKAITHRSAAIKSALDRYNHLAPHQKPPCPKLDFAEVVNYVTLREFKLLKHSRSGVLDKPWALSSNREMVMKYFKVLRAKEEIERLNVEMQRLHAWLDADVEKIDSVTQELERTEQLGLA